MGKIGPEIPQFLYSSLYHLMIIPDHHSFMGKCVLTKDPFYPEAHRA